VILEDVVTTVTKASREAADRQNDHTGRGTRCTRRQVPRSLETPKSVRSCSETWHALGQRQGGYTRIVRLGFRGDGAEQPHQAGGRRAVKRAAERAQRREDRLKQREGREEGEGESGVLG
jgi:hypothetical protein